MIFSIDSISEKNIYNNYIVGTMLCGFSIYDHYIDNYISKLKNIKESMNQL
jgi:hypothetical protein